MQPNKLHIVVPLIGILKYHQPKNEKLFYLIYHKPSEFNKPVFWSPLYCSLTENILKEKKKNLKTKDFYFYI